MYIAAALLHMRVCCGGRESADTGSSVAFSFGPFICFDLY